MWFESQAAPRMSAELGSLIGAGRAADVYDQGNGTVLRRYRSDRPSELEARMMTWLLANGIAVPAVHSASGRDIVMDNIKGLTMMQDLAKRPRLLLTHARTLATLQRQINNLEAPDWFPRHDGVTSGNAVVHLDLHPMNVILGPNGPVVIDWTNAARGDASFDAAMTYVLGSTYHSTNRIERFGQRAFVGSFAMIRGRRPIRAALHNAVHYRLLDPNITTGENAMLKRTLRSTRS